MSQLLIQGYLAEIDRLQKFSGLTNEQVIRPAFRRLLDQWATSQKLVFLEEYRHTTSQKTIVYPDGTVLHDIRVPLGHWEAKDTNDDLDEEIAKKLRKGYPQDNIIFENSHTAVLIQNRQEVTRCAMTDTDALLHLLTLFFRYERQEIAEFRRAVAKFRDDLPAVLEALREKIDAAYDGNAAFRSAADRFLAHARNTINPTLGEADVREMLIQHILTEEIFAHVFDNADFHRENNIARELYALEGKFFTGAVKRGTLRALEPYYATIRSNAALITSHHEKQAFLKAIYETFYKVYNPKAADRLGVVYTPNEIVKFMIEGADWLCHRHFGRTLIDRDVEILDPATGTGTFICELIEHFAGDKAKLARKYKHELHANEVAILPYYVANLNIEATYYGVAGQYAEFENLCFVDTLDNVAGLGIRAGYQHDMFAALSEENVERVKRQNKRKISVIIGNPPYNAWQENFNMRNPNRPYRRIDERIRGTYFRLGTAQNRNSVYDMYTRFFRWASDRLHDDGVLALITNRNFIEKAAFDGFRRAIEREFNEIHVLDLGGDVRANPKISGTKHNVFGIQTGVAISFMVKRHRQQGCKIFYARRPEFDTKEDKLGFLAGTKASAIAWQRIEPNEKAIWLQQTDNDWDELIPMASKAAKAGRSGPKAQAVFKLFSSGLKTQRDEWTYDVSRKALEEKMRYFVSAYEATRKDRDFGDRDTIKWDAVLASALSRGIKKAYHAEQIRPAAYRPFTRKFVYFDQTFNGRTYQLPDMFPLGTENIVISFSGVGSRADFCVSSWNGPVDLHYGAAADAYQVVSRYRYTKDGERVDNVTDWALRKFREAYGPSRLAGSGLAPQDKDGEADGREHPLAAHPSSGPPLRAFPPSPARGEEKQAAITKDNIFHYVYGVLHDPVYRETYALNLKREFPRIPFYPNFRQWTEWGRRLMALHIGYEAVEPWPLKRTDVADDKARAAGVPPKTLLKPDRDNDIIRIDGETTLSGVPAAAWKYRLGNRSGLEWILDQYRERTPKDLTIREKFNTYRFEYHKEKVIDLLMRVTRVSVETMEIVEEMQRARR